LIYIGFGAVKKLFKQGYYLNFMKKEAVKDLHEAHKKKINQKNLSEKYADFLTENVGSWHFLAIFLIFLVLWISVDVYAWIERWDPYPFVFLNLVLAVITSIQAPIILMSQNRREQKDRIKLEYDYKINIKAEKEIEEIKKQLARIENKLFSLEKKKS